LTFHPAVLSTGAFFPPLALRNTETVLLTLHPAAVSRTGAFWHPVSRDSETVLLNSSLVVLLIADFYKDLKMPGPQGECSGKG